MDPIWIGFSDVGGNGGGVGPPFVGVVVTVARLMLEEGALVD